MVDEELTLGLKKGRRQRSSFSQLCTNQWKTVGIWDRKEVTRMKRCTLFCFSCFSRLFVEAVWFYLSCLVKHSNSGCFYGCTRPSNSGFKMLCLILNTFIQNSAIFGDIFGIFTDFKVFTASQTAGWRSLRFSVNRWLIKIRHDRPRASDSDENGSFVNLNESRSTFSEHVKSYFHPAGTHTLITEDPELSPRFWDILKGYHHWFTH